MPSAGSEECEMRVLMSYRDFKDGGRKFLLTLVFTGRDGVTDQKTSDLMNTAVRTSSLETIGLHMVRGGTLADYKWLKRQLAERDLRTELGKQLKENFEINTNVKMLKL